MEDRVRVFFHGLQSKRVAFIGAGVSHRELISLFAAKGIPVTLRDKRTPRELGELYELFSGQGVRMVLGPDYLEGLEEEDVVFRTPGMYYNNPKLTAAREKGVAVTSEMEVFFDLCPCPIYAVTGSDGKTTTTTVISEFWKAQGKTVHLGGNIGRALLPIIEDVRPGDVAVVELSSFQLISMRRSPDVAVVTNVSPNHLDVHGTMEEYIGAKKNILLHQNAFSRAVINADNETAAAMAPLVRGELFRFSRQQGGRPGTWLDGEGIIWAADRRGAVQVMDSRDIRIPGVHNVENYLAAIAAVWGQVSPENIRRVAREFGGVEHRIEYIRTLDGVKWYNDSIATSPTRTIAGLNSFSQKLILIAGGYDKKIPFEPLAPKVLEKVKVLILTGATAGKIEAAVTGCPGYDPSALRILHAKDLEDAVQKARSAARAGDIVTLSPACASFDNYPNFEARGRHFKALVNALEQS